MLARCSPLAALSFPVLLAACGGGGPLTVPEPPRAQTLSALGDSKCVASASRSSPLVVEWPSTERAKLESLAHGGVIPVRYADCRMKALPACKVTSGYRYVALTPKHDVLRVRNEAELRASMPVYGASFEGKLKQAGELTVTMTIVGRYEAERSGLSAADLEGNCEEATHVVTSVTSGAFQFATGGASEASGGASFLGAGAGGKAAASRETLAADGDEAACRASAEGASAPPFGCGAFLRLDIEPLAKIKARTPPKVATEPASAREAVAPLDTTCPGGTSFVKGRGCVAELAPSSRYAVKDGAVVDGTTKLTWMRAPETSGVTWSDASAFCAGLSLHGGGWRLPRKEELLALGENLPAGIDRNAFPAATSREQGATAATVYYWSATPHPVAETMAWSVRFASMGAQGALKTRNVKNWVRCVK